MYVHIHYLEVLIGGGEDDFILEFVASKHPSIGKKDFLRKGFCIFPLTF